MTYTVLKQPTNLQLAAPVSLNAVSDIEITVGDPIPLVATLTDNDGDPLAEKSVRFVLTPAAGGTPIEKAVITNPNGEAPLGVVNAPPGDYTIQAFFQGTSALQDSDSAAISLTINEAAAEVVRLIDSQGAPIEGAVAKYYSAGWKNIGTTNASGEVAYSIPAGSYPFSITYQGASIQKNQDIGSSPTVEFQTVKVTASLTSSTGQPLQDGLAKFYASGWKDIGTTDGSGQTMIELLPKEYSFSMTYKGGRVEQVVDVSGGAAEVAFTTVLAGVKLQDSSGAPLAGGTAQFYASGWKNIDGTTDDVTGIVSTELLPRSYSFAMNYGGGRLEKAQDISVDQTVVFSTTLVTVTLQTSTGDPLDGGDAAYYASGWKDIGTTGDEETAGAVSIELLPKEYAFAMTFRGGRVEKTQDVGLDPNVAFATVNVNVELIDEYITNEVIEYVDDGGTAEFYASGWKPFGDYGNDNNLLNGQVQDELLPRSYNFAVVYNGKRNEITQDVSGDATVSFGVGIVYCSACTQFYASGWKLFEDGMYMLPGEYDFRLDVEGTISTVAFTVIEGTENYVDDSPQ